MLSINPKSKNAKGGSIYTKQGVYVKGSVLAKSFKVSNNLVVTGNVNVKKDLIIATGGVSSSNVELTACVTAVQNKTILIKPIGTSALVTSYPSSGNLGSMVKSRQFSYTPHTDFVGVDVFTYQCVDNMGSTRTVFQRVNVVSNSNVAPFANNDIRQLIVGSHDERTYTFNIRDIVVANSEPVNWKTLEITSANWDPEGSNDVLGQLIRVRVRVSRCWDGNIYVFTPNRKWEGELEKLGRTGVPVLRVGYRVADLVGNYSNVGTIDFYAKKKDMMGITVADPSMYLNCTKADCDPTTLRILACLRSGFFEFRNPDGFRAGRLCRLGPASYVDGISSPPVRPNARMISNVVHTQGAYVSNPKNCSDLFWLFGQVLDHDVDLTDGDALDPLPISVPSGDASFDPLSTGTQVMGFSRSHFFSGTGVSTPREQVNAITPFIDATNIYGSTSARNTWLREFAGGRLRVSAGNLLPYNDGSQPNAGGTSRTLLVAGDVRANENVALLTIHTLFLREHNWWATQLAKAGMTDDDEIYQRARLMVESEIQAITFNEFLPLLLGDGVIPAYTGYDPSADERIMNEFSTAAYRLGHSLLSDVIVRTGEDGNTIPEGDLPLRDAFFNPTEYAKDLGAPLLRGMAGNVCQKIDTKVIDNVRNFLFGNPGAGGLDLASLNIQRGRDHGLPDYNTLRVAMGLGAKATFGDITSDAGVETALSTAYGGDISLVDPWTGGLAEDPVVGSQLGELFHTIVRDQFIALRDSDPFWYERRLDAGTVALVNSIRLSDIIKRNYGVELQENCMVV